jgi:transcriptional regulator with XRE-family HTH domain
MLRNQYSEEEKCLRELLKEARTAAGLRQADLAAALGVPQSFVSKYESGERLLSFIETIVVLEQLNVAPARVHQKILSIIHASRS